MNITGYPQVPHILKWADPYLYLLHLLTLSHLKIKSGRSLKWSCRLQWWMHAWHKMAWAYRKRGGVFGQVHNIRLFFKHAVLNHVPRQVGPLSYTTEEEKSDHWFRKSGNERVERVRTVAYINTHRLTQYVNIFYVLLCFLEFQRRVVANSHFSTQRPVIVTGWAGNLKPCSTKHWLSFFSFLLVNSYSTSWCFDLHKVKYTMLIRQFKKYSKEIDRNCCIYSQFVYLTTVPIKQIQ